MLNEILHIRSLGAARNTSGSYSRSSTSTSSTTNSSRGTTTDTNQTSTSNNTTSNNTTASSNVSKYSSLLQTLSDGKSYLTLSDGSKIWSIQSSAMSSRSATDSVEHNLNVFLTKYSRIINPTGELEKVLKVKGAKKVVVTDLARSDMAENVEDAFRYSKLVLATTTYNGEIFPFMREFIHELTERNYSNRKVAFIENGSWMPMAKKVMLKMLEDSKNLEYCENSVKILSSLSNENIEEINKLADELV